MEHSLIEEKSDLKIISTFQSLRNEGYIAFPISSDT